MVLFIFMEQRLQKIIAEMGLASRRKSEEMIIEGRVTVNGRVVSIGTKADPVKDHIKVDGKLITSIEKKVYILFNKPRGVVTSLSDPQGRPTVKDYLRGIKQRVYPVGRLDYDSEGLLLLTNDGAFTHSILHPSKKVPKTYQVKIKGIMLPAAMEKVRNGIILDGVRTAPAKIKTVRKTEHNSWIEMTIYEGKKRQIRRMFQRLGHSVIRLIRIKINGIALGSLPAGSYRHLLPEEKKKLLEELQRGEAA